MTKIALHNPDSPGNSVNALFSKRCALIATITFVSYAYFYQGGGWNQNSRFDLIRAILEGHTLSIDAYQSNTHDKAYSRGHFYSDKAPGVAFLALPFVVVAKPFFRPWPIGAISPGGLEASSYVATIGAAALPAALACAGLFLISVRLGSSMNGGLFAALSMGLATPIWPYATLLWGSAVAGACLLFALIAILALRPDRRGSDCWFWGMLLGLSAGWATVCEYPAGPPAVLLAFCGLARVWQAGWKIRWATAAGILAGALPCVIFLMSYQRLAFGSAFHPSYSYYQEGSFPWMQHGYLGLTFPRADIALKLLFGCRRGLFYFSPVLIVATIGLAMMSKKIGGRIPAFAAGGITAYYLLFNASFSAWEAGQSYGPRYMGAAIPLLCLGLAAVFDQVKTVGRGVMLTLASCGALFSLMAVAVAATPPNIARCPLMGTLWLSFWSGNLAINHASMLLASEVDKVHDFGATNFGELLGLRGLVSLTPLIFSWFVFGVLWFRIDRRESAQCAVEP